MSLRDCAFWKGEEAKIAAKQNLGAAKRRYAAYVARSYADISAILAPDDFDSWVSDGMPSRVPSYAEVP